MSTRGLWVVALGLLAGCIPEARLQPLPEAQSLVGDTSAAVAEAQGVRLVADGAAWDSYPQNLERRLTPVEVRLENHSGRPLSIRYEHFDVEGSSRFQYAAIPPMSLDEATRNNFPVCAARYSPQTWDYRWGWYGRGWARTPLSLEWPNPFYDPLYDPFFTPNVRCEEPLPTQDMLKQALPEGTLENGGTVAGFLYFQGVTEREKQVTLQAQLVDARTGEPFGSLSIPFEVARK
ncbi:MAG TPA: hypothetical protein VF815_04130 [Myxococcaceae bacterium]|jgi:hypothetical protein